MIGCPDGFFFVAVDFLAHAGGAAGQIDPANLLRSDTNPVAKRRLLFLIFDQVLLVDKGKSRNVFYGFEIRRFYPGVIKPLPLEITILVSAFKRLLRLFKLPILQRVDRQRFLFF
mgnify:CR=1 FL=1